MALREEELVMLFEVFESMTRDIVGQYIETGDCHPYGDFSENTQKLKQQCIDVIAFGEKLVD